MHGEHSPLDAISVGNVCDLALEKFKKLEMESQQLRSE